MGSGQTDVPLPCRPRIRHGRRHRPAPCRDRSRESGRVAQPSAGPFDGCHSEGAATDVVTVPDPGRVRLDDRGRFQSGTAGRGTWLTIPERPPLRVRGQLPSFAASTVASPGRRSPKSPKTGSAAPPGRPRRSRSGASAVGAPCPPKPRRAGVERPRGASSQALPQLSIAKAGSSGSAPGIGPTHLTRAANAAARCPISGAAPANQSVSSSPRTGGAAAR